MLTTLNGGTGTDEARYNQSNEAVQVNLATGVTSGGHAAGDTFNSIENLAGSQFNDTLIGDNGVNRLDGFTGNDLLQGGLGADELFGGLGQDTADYSDSAVGVDVGHFRIGTGGTSQGDRLIQVEGIIGSNFNDTLVGSGVYALAELSGGAGDDLLFDYGGASQMNGGSGNDTMIGRLGADAFDGGADIDVVRYADAIGAVNVNLATGMGTGADAQGDTYVNVENVVGSNFFDTLTGDNQGNRIEGMGGRDRITGGGGTDLLFGGTGIDTFVYDTTNWGNDLIYDFDATSEFIDVSAIGLTFASFTVVDTAFGIRLDYTDPTNGFQSISLGGVDVGDISAANFVTTPPAPFMAGLEVPDAGDSGGYGTAVGEIETLDIDDLGGYVASDPVEALVLDALTDGGGYKVAETSGIQTISADDPGGYVANDDLIDSLDDAGDPGGYLASDGPVASLDIDDMGGYLVPDADDSDFGYMM